MVDLAPWQQSAVDWDATMAFRRHLWGLGFKIAEAMDTSQRGMGLDWPTARELIRRSVAEARTIAGADLACGVGTDQLAPGGLARSRSGRPTRSSWRRWRRPAGAPS